jgi:protein phosphatase
METNWTILDAELLPWSAKARTLIASHYAPISSAAKRGLGASISALSAACESLWLEPGSREELARLLEIQKRRLRDAEAYTTAWHRYCWETHGLSDLKFAPFQILAVEGRLLSGMSHMDHLRIIDEHLAGEEIFLSTKRLEVNVSDLDSRRQGEEFWLALTASGDEGIVVKPLATNSDVKTKTQPALKCRGRDYLRIIYGPDYAQPENIMRLKQRRLERKRKLALDEYALGLEALERFVKGASLDKVHECVFAVLALETEPLDPRL